VRPSRLSGPPAALPPEATRAVKTHHEAHFIRSGSEAWYAYRLAYGELPIARDLSSGLCQPVTRRMKTPALQARRRRAGSVEGTGAGCWTIVAGLDAAVRNNPKVRLPAQVGLPRRVGGPGLPSEPVGRGASRGCQISHGNTTPQDVAFRSAPGE